MAPGSTGATKLSKLLRSLDPSTWWSRLDLDTHSFLLLLKGALPPTIVIAIHQSNAVADITVTVGYLSALISVLSQALLPRAKFMKIMFFNLLATCVSASLCCLAVFCAVKARQYNMPADAGDGYSSDASAVSAVWLVVMIWGGNTLRAWRPMELQDPMVAFSIFTSVTITRGGTFTTVDEGLSFITRLIKGFMLGFAIATGVSLLVLPITSRGNVFQDIKGYVSHIDAVLQAQILFIKRSSTGGIWTGDYGLLHRARTAQSAREDSRRGASNESLESKKQHLQSSLMKLSALHGKLQSDLFYSKYELAWGKLSADDLNEIAGLLQNILLPLSGMAMLPEILEMVIENKGTRNNSHEIVGTTEEEAAKRSEMHKVVGTLEKHLANSTELMHVGLQYALLVFELMTSKQVEKKRNGHSGADDEESKGDLLDPLQQDFTTRFEHSLNQYYSRRRELPDALASLEPFAEKNDDVSSTDGVLASDPDVRQEFFLIVYMGHLQDDLLNATLELIKYADSKVTDDTMKRSRLIFPKQKSIRHWLSLNADEKESDRRQSSYIDQQSIHQDHEPNKFPNPETLPPTNIWERASTILCSISHLIRSEESIFGSRVAAASFCVGIVAFLHQTQEFFIYQRGVWAMIVIVIGMSPTSGQTLFGFIARIAATVVSLALSLVVWYIVDGRTAGVIVFLYLANVFEYYFYVKVPQYFGAAMIAIVTMNVIVGYELQVRKLGLDLATSNGQPYYPIYLFGPYKLATVAIGCGISFFWVLFPFSITAKSRLRKLLGRSLFALAQFYSCMHATVQLWLNGELDGDLQDELDSGFRVNALRSTRRRLFREEMTLLNALRIHSHFTTFEPAIGGKFPKPVYDEIISETQRILTSMALMAHITQSLNTLSSTPALSQPPGPPQNPNENSTPENKWTTTRLASIAMNSPTFNSHSTASLLCHLSAALTNAQPLPPYLSASAGDSFPLARQMQRIDNELLSIRHVWDSGFSAFVALEVLRSVVSFGLRDLVRNVRSLVGEFSFDLWRRVDDDDRMETERLMSAVDQAR